MSATTTTTTTTTATALPTSIIVQQTEVTADNVTRLFPEVTTRLIGADLAPNSTSLAQNTHTETDPHDETDPLSGYDEEQIRLMDEMCVVLDKDDKHIGAATKKYTHLMSNINQGLLHRAFSVFLFHPTTHKLLLQQRASEKITFPDMWTNTCCSHPLAHPSEVGNGELASNIEGAKRAAVRKLEHELGITTRAGGPTVKDFEFLTRIHYLAPSDGKWGEHEIDYILFTTADPEVHINENEIQDSKWVTRDDLRQMFKDHSSQTGRYAQMKWTPWFKLICETMLFKWWEALEQGQLAKYTGETQIRRM